MSIIASPAFKKLLNDVSRSASVPPVAVFDCDGTVIKGDIGEAMLYYQIEHFLFRTSPAEVWEDFPRRDDLGRAYDRLRKVAAPVRAAQEEYAEFAEMILSWYFGQIEDGQVAKACADIVRLFAGYTLPEVRRIADQTFITEAAAPVSDRRLGGRTLPRGIRFLRETVELVRILREKGVHVWALSGSSAWSVEPVFHALGVPPERVIGITLEVSGGLLTGTPHEPVPIRAKKVDALKERCASVPVLVASDSRNDIPLLQYSSGVRIVVNSRNRDPEEFFRTGNIARDDSWLVIDRPTADNGEPAPWQTFR